MELINNIFNGGKKKDVIKNNKKNKDKNNNNENKENNDKKGNNENKENNDKNDNNENKIIIDYVKKNNVTEISKNLDNNNIEKVNLNLLSIETNNDENLNSSNIIEIGEAKITNINDKDRIEFFEMINDKQELYYSIEQIKNYIYNLLYMSSNNNEYKAFRAQKITELYESKISYKEIEENFNCLIPIVYIKFPKLNNKISVLKNTDIEIKEQKKSDYQNEYRNLLKYLLSFITQHTNNNLLIKIQNDIDVYGVLHNEDYDTSSIFEDSSNIIENSLNDNIDDNLYILRALGKIINNLKNEQYENYYDGTYINLMGFYYKISRSKKYNTFNINKYINDLYNMKVNDKLLIFLNDKYIKNDNIINEINGTIIKIDEIKHIITIKLDNKIKSYYDKENIIDEIEYDIIDLYKNNYIIYNEVEIDNYNYIYKKKDLLNTNILFIFDGKYNVKNDKNFYINNIKNFILPKINELLYIYEDIIKDNYTSNLIEYLLSIYKYDFETIFHDNNSYKLYQKFIDNIISNIKNNDKNNNKENNNENNNNENNKNNLIKNTDIDIYNNYKLLLESLKEIIENQKSKKLKDKVSYYEKELEKIEKSGDIKYELNLKDLEKKGHLKYYENDIEMILDNTLYNNSIDNKDIKNIQYAIVENISNYKNDKYIQYFNKLKEKIITENNDININKNNFKIFKEYNTTLQEYLDKDYLLNNDLSNLGKNNSYFQNRMNENKDLSPCVFIRYNNKWIYIGFINGNGNINILDLYKMVLANYNNLWELSISELENIKELLNIYNEQENMKYLRDMFQTHINIDELLKMIKINIENINIQINLLNIKDELLTNKRLNEIIKFKLNIEKIYKNIEGDLDDDGELFWNDMDNIMQYSGELKVDQENIIELYMEKNEFYNIIMSYLKYLNIDYNINDIKLLKEYCETSINQKRKNEIINLIKKHINKIDKNEKDKLINIIQELQNTKIFILKDDLLNKIFEISIIKKYGEHYINKKTFKAYNNFHLTLLFISFSIILLRIHKNDIHNIMPSLGNLNNISFKEYDNINTEYKYIKFNLIHKLKIHIVNKYHEYKPHDKECKNIEVLIDKIYKEILDNIPIFDATIQKIDKESDKNNELKENIVLNNWDTLRPVEIIKSKNSKIENYLNEIYKYMKEHSHITHHINILSNKLIASSIVELTDDYNYYKNININYDKSNTKYIKFENKENIDNRKMNMKNIILPYKDLIIDNKLNFNIDVKKPNNKNILDNKIVDEDNIKNIDIIKENLNGILELPLIKDDNLLSKFYNKLKENIISNKQMDLTDVNKIYIEFKKNIDLIYKYLDNDYNNLKELFISFKDFNNKSLLISKTNTNNNSKTTEINNKDNLLNEYKLILTKIINYDIKVIISRIINEYNINTRIKIEKNQKSKLNKWTSTEEDLLYKIYKIKSHNEYIINYQLNIEKDKKNKLKKNIMEYLKTIKIDNLILLNDMNIFKLENNITILLYIFTKILISIFNIINKIFVKDNISTDIIKMILYNIFTHLRIIFDKLLLLNDYDNENYKNKNDKIEKLMRKLKEKAKNELIERRMKEIEEINLDSSIENAIDALANEYIENQDENIIENKIDIGDGRGDDEANIYYNEDACEA